MGKKILVLYGTNNYENSMSSLVKSSNNYFDECLRFKPEDIDEEFFNKNRDILTQ